ncbi:MAG: hypothetical protein HY937_03665 [Nitrosomonadales bacterium]|nr:hypothetical protein [Nitrosomonadales bacterium]
MSPSWRNRLYIAISPERISLLSLGRGLTMRIHAKHDEAVVPSGKQPSWRAVLDRLTQMLSKPEWQGAEVNIVLSNRLVRYATISFSAQLQNYSVQEAFARHYLTQVYGTATERWDLRIQPGKAGSPRLVSAVDRMLLDELRQVCVTHKLELRTVSPYLMPVFNCYRKAIKRDPAWLVIHEPGYSLFALLDGWKFVAVNGVCHYSLDELPMLLDRENLTSPLAEPCKLVYLLAPSGNGLATGPQMGYEFSKLDMAIPDAFPSSADGLYGMALSGVL